MHVSKGKEPDDAEIPSLMSEDDMCRLLLHNIHDEHEKILCNMLGMSETQRSRVLDQVTAKNPEAITDLLASCNALFPGHWLLKWLKQKELAFRPKNNARYKDRTLTPEEVIAQIEVDSTAALVYLSQLPQSEFEAILYEISLTDANPLPELVGLLTFDPKMIDNSAVFLETLLSLSDPPLSREIQETHSVTTKTSVTDISFNCAKIFPSEASVFNRNNSFANFIMSSLSALSSNTKFDQLSKFFKMFAYYSIHQMVKNNWMDQLKYSLSLLEDLGANRDEIIKTASEKASLFKQCSSIKDAILLDLDAEPLI